MEEMIVLYHGTDSFRQKIIESFNDLGSKNVIGNINVTRFPDNEFKPKSETNLRKKNVFIISSFLGYDQKFDPNIGLTEYMILIDMVKRASPSKIIAVMPYYPYGRQDRKDESRVPVSAKLMADLIERAGATNTILFEPHSQQIQSFGDIPSDRLSSDPLFGDYFFKKLKIDPQKWTFLAPDVGAMKTLRDFKENMDSAFGIDIKIAMIEKERLEDDVVSHYLVGEITENVIIKDDMISSGQTIEKAAEKAIEYGAKKIWACATHGLLTVKDNISAEERMKKAGIEKIFITDSIPKPKGYLEKNKGWIDVVSCVPLLAKACTYIQKGQSLSELFAIE